MQRTKEMGARAAAWMGANGGAVRCYRRPHIVVDGDGGQLINYMDMEREDGVRYCIGVKRRSTHHRDYMLHVTCVP
jgi:hypothetical protein